MNTGHVILAAGAEPPPGGREQGSGSVVTAWRQELRRAFARGWFHGPMEPRESRGAGAFSQVRAGAGVSVTDCGARLGSGWGSEARTREQRHPGLTLMMASSRPGAAQIQSRSSGELPGPVLPARAEAMNARDSRPLSDPHVDRTAGSPARTVSAEHHDTVRIHVEHGEHGSKVWIGLDGDASFVGGQAQAIVAELARIVQGTPCRLATVICNGAVVYGQGASFGTTTRKDSPWP